MAFLSVRSYFHYSLYTLMILKKKKKKKKNLYLNYRDI